MQPAPSQDAAAPSNQQAPTDKQAHVSADAADNPEQHKQQPRDLAGVVQQLSNNAEAIAAAEEVLRELLVRQTALHLMGRKMEQLQVLSVLQQGHLGFDKGRPVVAVLLYRCLQQWGLLHQTEPCPFLEQLASVLQQQLDLDGDASAPAEVAGLQCHVANSLTLCAVLYCVLIKASHPELAAAAAAAQDSSARGSKQQQLHASAAEVVAAARKKVSATWQQGIAHVGPGLQALGKLKLGGWGLKRPDEHQQTAAAGGGGGGASRSSSTSSSQVLQPPGSVTTDQHPPAHVQQQQQVHASTPAAKHPAADSIAGGEGSQQQASDTTPSSVDTAAPAGAGAAAGVGASTSSAAAVVTAEAVLHPAAPLGAFLLCLDHMVQQSYVLLRDQLKRRLTPLLADCVSPENNVILAGDAEEVTAAAPAGDDGDGGAAAGEPVSPTAAAGAAVAGSAAESAAHAEAALMSYRSWSEMVGVLHAALVALRAAHVPSPLRSQLMQQVLEFINCQLFNQLLLRPDCCSISNARYALRGLKQLDTWIIAEQQSSSAAPHNHHASAGAGGGAVTGVGSVHTSSGSFNSQAAPALAAAGVTAVYPATTPATAGGGGGAADADDDSGWEQVPADAGEFGSWRPPAKQQQQQPWWRSLTHQQQQQQQHGAHQHPSEQPELGPEAWNALSHVRQALQFLVFEDKGALGLEDLTEHVCPALNHQQLYRLCTTAWSEEPDTPTGSSSGGAGGVSGEVLEQMKELYTLSSNGGLIVTFLLDEPSGPLPFVQQHGTAGGGGGSGAAAASSAHGSSAVNSAGGGGGGGGGIAASRCRLSAVVCWDDGRDFGLGLKTAPSVLTDDGCPAEVFEFLAVDQAWPPAGAAAAHVHVHAHRGG